MRLNDHGKRELPQALVRTNRNLIQLPLLVALLGGSCEHDYLINNLDLIGQPCMRGIKATRQTTATRSQAHSLAQVPLIVRCGTRFAPAMWLCGQLRVSLNFKAIRACAQSIGALHPAFSRLLLTMEAELQPRLDTRSRHSSLPPIRVTESPASGAPPADGALALEDGLQIHNDHQRGLDEFRSVFNNKMKNKPVKHDHVHVLIWTWGERLDDLKVKEEVGDLLCDPSLTYTLTQNA